MATLLQIRNVPDEARRTLKARAVARGQSMNSYLLGLIEREVARPTVAEVLERAARRSERSPVSSVSILEAARNERDAELQNRIGR